MKRGTPEGTIGQEPRKQSAEEEMVPLRQLEEAQLQVLSLQQLTAELRTEVERARGAQVMLQGRLAAGQEEEEAAAQAVLDSSLLSARLGVRDKERAKGVVDLLRTMHSLGVDALPQRPLQRLQVTEMKRNLNRALRCLVLENQSAAHTAIWEVLRFLDRHEAADLGGGGEAPSIQVVFIEGESLIFRMMNLRLQPRDVYLLCSLGDECPRGGWGLKAVLAVSDAPVVFSAPFQLRIDAASRGPQGVLCPEWVPSPDATLPGGTEPVIPPVYQARIKDNCTLVYAPLRPSAQALLRVADMSPFEGLSLAFSSRTRSVELMLVSYEGPAEVKVVRTDVHTAQLSPVALPEAVAPEAGAAAARGVAALRASVRVAGHRAADCVVRLSSSTKVSDRTVPAEPRDRRYRLHDFSVSLLGVAEGADVEGERQAAAAATATRITLAFPLDQDGRPLRRERRRKQFPEARGQLHTESIFCGMPVARGGKLPFAVNADFDLTGDNGGLHPTSSWNHWLLGCVARLFVFALLRDPLLRDHAELYMPLAEETPPTGLWTGMVEAVDRLLQAYLFVETEGGRLVARRQAVARPVGLGRELVSDVLLGEVTRGLKHFAAAANDGGADGGPGIAACPLELVLQCVEGAQARGRLLDDRALAHLWAYLAGALAPSRETGAGEEKQEGLSAEAKALLQYKLALFPVQGQLSPRAFCVDGVRVFLPPPVPQQPPFDPVLAPLLDETRLRSAGLAVNPTQLRAAFRLVGVREATPAEVEAMVLGLFKEAQQQQAEGQEASAAAAAAAVSVLQDPDRFWALRTLVVERLGAGATLRAFLGDKVALVLPGLEAVKSGDGVVPRLLRVEPGVDPSERFLLPTFLGVPLGPLGALLHQTAAWEQPIKSGRKGLLCPPGLVTAAPSLAAATPALAWGALVQWEAAMLAEVGVDGGSNRNWAAALALCPPQDLAAAVVAGLRDAASATEQARAAFAALLDGYLEQHAQVFEAIRASHRPPNAELLQLATDPRYGDTPRGAPLRFTRGFAEACVGLLQGEPSLPVDSLTGVLPMAAPVAKGNGGGGGGGGGGVDEGDAALARFEKAVNLAVLHLDSLFAAAWALHVLTRRLQERGFLMQADGGGWRAQGQDAAAWGRLLAALFRRAVENLGHAYGAGIRNRKRKRPGAGGSKDLLEEDAGLLQAYCREFGLWLNNQRKEGAGPSCVPLAQVVWSLDDPVARLVQGAAEAEAEAEGVQPSGGQAAKAAGPALVALDRELSGVLEAEEEEEGAGGREMVRRFFTEGLGLGGEGRFKPRLLVLLRQGLARWAEHKGPMPRRVEQAYRALGEAAAAAASSASKAGGGGAFGFEEVPVLTLGFQEGALAVLPPGRNGGAPGIGSSYSNGGSGGAAGAITAEELARSAQQALVEVKDEGDEGDSALHCFYREFFPSRCLHPAILAVFRACSPTALLPRLRLAQPRQCFLESYADNPGSTLSIMKAMNVDLIKAAKIVAELYAGTAPSITTAAAATATPAQLPVTEAQRYWANAKELRDLVLEEVWRVASDPTGAQRNEELVEAVKNTLRLPLARRTGLPPMAPLEMVSAARAADGGERHGPPVYLGSILGIDLELQDKGDELPRLVKHPHASKEFGWHRNVRPEEGFQAVEQSIYWERFLLEMGVKPLDEKHLSLISREVLTKIYVTLVKFNSLLSGPDQTVASKYAVWTSYHFLYQAIDGGRYISRYKGIDTRAAAAPSPDATAAAAAAAAAAALSAAQQQQHVGAWDAGAAAYPAPMGLQASHSGSGGYPAYYGAGAGAGGHVPPVPPQMGYAYAPAPAPAAAPVAVPAPAPPPPSMSAGGLPPPPVKRQRESPGVAADETSPAPPKAPRLVPPVPPPAPAAPVQEEGEIEEGEIEG